MFFGNMHVQTVRRDKATVTVTARKGGLLRRLGWRCNVLGFSEDDAQVLKNVRQDCDVRLCAGDPLLSCRHRQRRMAESAGSASCPAGRERAPQ